MIETKPDKAERAAPRWLGGLCLERTLSLDQVREAANACAAVIVEVEAAEAVLRRLAKR